MTDMAIFWSVKGDGNMVTRGCISLPDGDRKVVTLHHQMSQPAQAPRFAIIDRAGEHVTLEVTYMGEEILITRTHFADHPLLGNMLTANGVLKRQPKTEVWRKLDPAMERCSLPLTAFQSDTATVAR